MGMILVAGRMPLGLCCSVESIFQLLFMVIEVGVGLNDMSDSVSQRLLQVELHDVSKEMELDLLKQYVQVLSRLSVTCHSDTLNSKDSRGLNLESSFALLSTEGKVRAS